MAAHGPRGKSQGFPTGSGNTAARSSSAALSRHGSGEGMGMELTIDDLEDVKLELSSIGHNLTSVLMNPRDTVYDEIMEDLWDDITSEHSTLSTSGSNVNSSHGLTTADSLMALSALSGHQSSGNLHAVAGMLSLSASASGSGHSPSGGGGGGGGGSAHGGLASVPITGQPDESMRYLRAKYPQFAETHKVKVPAAQPHGDVKIRSEDASESGSVTRTPSSSQRNAADTENQAANCFRLVPDVFFASEFSLANPRIFEEILNPSNSSGNAQQKRLSDYLDLVENALLQQIWSRSTDIFNALDDIKGQQEHVTSAMSSVDRLRGHLREMDTQVASSALHIPLMHRRRGNEAKLLSTLLCMQRVLDGRNNVQTLLEGGDYLGALETLADCKEVYSTELQSVVSMRKVGEQLDAYDGFVCEVISNRFVSCAMATDWEDDGGIVASVSELEKLSSGAGDMDTAISEPAAELSLGQLMQALLMIGRLPPAFSMYKSRLIEGLKLVVRTCVNEYMNENGSSTASSDTADEGGGAGGGDSFAKRIRAMPIEQYLSSVIICFEHLLASLQRAHRVHLFMLSAFAGEEFIRIARENQQRLLKLNKNSLEVDAEKISEGLQELSKGCLLSACDIAQRALSQLMLMRKADTARLPLSTMKLLWETGSHFAAQVERFSGAGAYIIRQALQTQTGSFLANIHEQAKLRLANTMDAEKWTQCDVPADKQAQVDRLASGKAFLKNNSSSSSSLSNSSIASYGLNKVDTDSVHKNAAATNGKRRGKEIAPVLVDGVSFKVVWPALLLVELVMNYLEIAIGYPPITGEVITMTKELIELFNKTTLALVLGSGAQKSQAQLRSISAKHLTVTAQSLGLILAMLPHIRAALLTQLPPNRSVQLAQLDRISHELVEHHSQILTKFVIILGDSVEMSVHKLAAVNWDTASDGHTQIEYFQDVAKNVAALHRVLLLDSMLPVEQVQDVFSRIFSLILRKLPTHFEDIMPQTKTGRQRIIDEVTHLTAGFALLQSVNSSTEMAQLEDTFRRKFANI